MVTARSTCAASVSLAVSLAGLGSVVPAGALTVKVSETITSFGLANNSGAGLSYAGVNKPSANGSAGVINGSDLQHLTWSGLSLASGQSENS